MRFVLLFLLLGGFAKAQTFYRMRMDVMYVTVEKRVCLEDIDVYWGTHRDSLVFVFHTGNEPVALQIWADFTRQKGKDPDNIKKWHELKREEFINGDNTFYMTDRREDRYSVRMLTGKEGLLIFIKNLTKGSPIYFFDFTPNKICNQF